MAFNRLASLVEYSAVVKDVGFSMQPSLGVNFYLELLIFYHPHHLSYQVFPFVGLVHQLHAGADIFCGLSSHLLLCRPLGVRLSLGGVFNQFQMTVAFSQLLQCLAIGSVADEQA